MNPVIRYAFAALLLLGSPFSYADTGNFYQVSNSGGSSVESVTGLSPGDTFSPFLSSSECQQASDARRGGTSSSYRIYEEQNGQKHCQYYQLGWNTSFSATLESGTCPAAAPYLDESTGYCTDEQPISCEAGSDTFYVRWSFSELNDEGSQHSVIKQNGCLYDNTDIVECGVYSDELKGCKYQYTQTDNEASAGSGTEPEPQPYVDNETPEQSTSNDAGQTTYTEDPPVTNPDGSTTQTTNETTTNTSGSGTEVWNDDDYIYVRDSSGTTTIYDRQKTTTVNTDGSVDETVVTNKSNQTPTTTSTTINKNSGNVTTTNNNQSSTTTTTNITNNYYDSEGNLTGSDSTTEGGTETEGDENEEGNCGAPGQPACEVKLSGEDQLKDPGLAVEQSGAIAKMDEYISSFESVGNEDISDRTIDNPFNLPSTGVCDSSPFSYQYHGKTLNPMTKFCEAYDSTIHPILRYFFYALTAIVLYFTFINATTRT